jgi:hypothetical protein
MGLRRPEFNFIFGFINHACVDNIIAFMLMPLVALASWHYLISMEIKHGTVAQQTKID